MRSMSSDRGQTSLEWLGIGAVVVAVVATLVGGGAGIGASVADGFQQLVCRVALGDCGDGPTSETQVAQVSMAGGGASQQESVDSDGDGAPDALESQLGTDPTSPDTTFPVAAAPDPPAPPESGDGSGPFDSRSPGVRDHATDLAAGRLADAAEVAGLVDAARHMRHYLDASGEDLPVDPLRILEDVPSARLVVDNQLADVVADHRAAIDTAIAEGQPLVIPFETGWEGTYAGKDQSENWFFAMGGFSISQTGNVIVTPPAEPGGQPTITVEHQVHVFDRYNWDEGKAVTIGPVTIHDQSLGALHEAGLAQEYDITGSSSTQVIEVDADGLDALPGVDPDTGRDGDRDDPGREGRGGR